MTAINESALPIKIKAIEEKPALFQDLLDLNSAINILDYTRETDFGIPQPIKIDDMKAIFNIFSLSIDMPFREFIHLVITADSILRAARSLNTKQISPSRQNG